MCGRTVWRRDGVRRSDTGRSRLIDGDANNPRGLARISRRDGTNNIKDFAFPDRRGMGSSERDHCAAAMIVFNKRNRGPWDALDSPDALSLAR